MATLNPNTFQISNVYDPTWAGSLVTTATSSGSLFYSGATSGGWTYITPTSVKPAALTLASTKEYIDSVVEDLKQINLRYNILDPTLKSCEVLASKMFYNLLPKGLGEFGVSVPINGRRNVFVIVKTYEENPLPGRDPNVVETIVDICAAQHGGIVVQTNSPNLATPWITEFRYKNANSLAKRLSKEGWQPKELSLKDAIALSTRYTISGISPTQMDLHKINPSDTDGRKFLEKFGKEVGFKTTLAQLLLDSDPIVAEKAQIIAQLILQR
jgi:hypothetical protein